MQPLLDSIFLVLYAGMMRFFNDLSKTVTSRNRLPHWQQDGATFFVTWRLKDSIPTVLYEQWKRQRDQWIELNPRPWTEEIEAEFHRLFSIRLNAILDEAHGDCILRIPGCRKLLAESLAMFGGKRFLMHSWVAMPNHVHALFSLAEGWTLQKVIGGWKGNTAKHINSLLGSKGALWQKDYFDRMIRDWDHMFRVANYIRKNPAKAKLGEGEYTLYESPWVKKMLD